jgi:hypothetical protein
MKKIVKLTEADLARIVKRVINEGDDFVMPGQNMKGDFYDKVNMLINEYSDIDKHDILDVLENLSRQIRSEIRRNKSNM